MHDAFLVEAASHSDTEIGQMADYALARPALESYGFDLYIERPEAIREIVSDELDYGARVDDKKYICVELVAKENPDSVCATAHTNIERFADLQEDRLEARNELAQLERAPNASQTNIDAAKQKVEGIRTEQAAELASLQGESINKQTSLSLPPE